MKKYKNICEIIIYIIIIVVFLCIGIKENVLDTVNNQYKLEILLSLITKILSFVVSILAFIAIIMKKIFHSKKKFINIIIFVLSLIIICISIVKIINKYNSGKYFIDYPTEILNYNYDNEQFSSSIDKIEIEKKTEKIFTTKTYYKIYLSDEKNKRVVYICIDRKYHFKNFEWRTEHWEYYKDNEIENINL